MAKAPEKQNLPTSASAANVDPVAEEINKRLGSLVSASQRSQIVAQMTALVKEESFSGPIPHPRYLAEYDRIVPGSASMLINMAKADLDHAHRLQERALEADISDMQQGRWLGFAALVILMIGAIVCGLMDKDAIALALLGATVVGTIGQLVKGRGKNGD